MGGTLSETRRPADYLDAAKRGAQSKVEAEFKKNDAQTIEFRVPIPANGEKTVTYMVHYSW